MKGNKEHKCFNSSTMTSFIFTTQLWRQYKPHHTKNCFFVDGPAITGKTFLYNTLVHNLQGLGIKVKCVAYSGIASTLLINGATAHSSFQIPIPLLPDSTCNIKRQSTRAQKLLETTLFIWDEASMIPAMI